MKSKAGLLVPQKSGPHKLCGFQNYSQLGAATSKICCWLWHNERDNKYIKLGISWWKMKEILWTQPVNSAENPLVCSAWLMPWPFLWEPQIQFPNSAILFWRQLWLGSLYRDSGLIHCWEIYGSEVLVGDTEMSKLWCVSMCPRKDIMCLYRPGYKY